MNAATRDSQFDLWSPLERIETRQDLIDFIDLVAEALDSGYFDEQGLVNYVEGIINVLEGLDSLCANTGFPCPDPPDWRLVGRILLAAFYR